MIDCIIENPKLNKAKQIIVGIIFSSTIFFVYEIVPNSASLYLTMFLLLILGFKLFYQDTFRHVLFCTGACTLNLLSIRAISMGIISLATNLPILEIEHHSLLFTLYLILAFILTNIAMILVTRFIPLNYLRVINKQRTTLLLTSLDGY